MLSFLLLSCCAQSYKRILLVQEQESTSTYNPITGVAPRPLPVPTVKSNIIPTTKPTLIPTQYKLN